MTSGSSAASWGAWTSAGCRPAAPARGTGSGPAIAPSGTSWPPAMRWSGPAVVEAMYETFGAAPERPLWERLLAALEAGKRAGGEPNGEKSSGLYVVDREAYAMVDLRVDLHPEPVGELRRLADEYFPLVPYYNLRPWDPNLPRAHEWLAEQRAR